jgi:hypothetical protein
VITRRADCVHVFKAAVTRNIFLIVERRLLNVFFRYSLGELDLLIFILNEFFVLIKWRIVLFIHGRNFGAFKFLTGTNCLTATINSFFKSDQSWLIRPLSVINASRLSVWRWLLAHQSPLYDNQTQISLLLVMDYTPSLVQR